MITDADALAEIRKSWDGMRLIQGKAQTALLGAFATGGWSAIFAADTTHNLPFIHACAVLNEVLIQLREEGKFGGYRGWLMGKLMEASKTALAWADFDVIEQAVRARNDVAHRGALLPRRDCWEYIDAIEKELTAWGIVTSAPGRSRHLRA